MQVSWIDADHLKALVAQIAPSPTGMEDAPRRGLSREVPRVAESKQGDEPSGFVMDWVPHSLRAEPSAVPEAEAVVFEEPSPPEPMVEMDAEPDNDAEADLPPPQFQSPAALPLSRIRDKLRAIRQRASEAGILTRASSEVAPAPKSSMSKTAPMGDEEEAESIEDCEVAVTIGAVVTKEPGLSTSLPSAPAFNVPSGSRDVRLAAFAGWARKVLRENSGHVLVMSDDGEVLWGGEARAGLVLSTMMAWGAAVRASAMSACETPPAIHQTLASGNVLTVIPCETSGGMVHAAVAAPEGLTNEQAHILRGALCAVMN